MSESSSPIRAPPRYPIVPGPIERAQYEEAARPRSNITKPFEPPRPTRFYADTRTRVCNIDSAERDRTLYPDGNDFVWSKGQYKNVIQVTLSATQIPNTDQVIKGPGAASLQNNQLFWRNVEDYDDKTTVLTAVPWTVTTVGLDGRVTFTAATPHGLPTSLNLKIKILTGPLPLVGDRSVAVTSSTTLVLTIDTTSLAPSGTADLDVGLPIYSCSVTPGNYDSFSLATEIQTALSTVKRKRGLGDYHYFLVESNQDKAFMTFTSFTFRNGVPNGVQTTQGSSIVRVNALANGLHVGDTVYVAGIQAPAGIGGFLSSDLNGFKVLLAVDFDYVEYEINGLTATETATGGGSTIRLGTYAPFQFMFLPYDDYGVQNRSLSLANPLGFPRENTNTILPSTNPVSPYVYPIVDHGIYAGKLQLFLDTTAHVLRPCTQITAVFQPDGIYATALTPHGLTTRTNVYIGLPANEIAILPLSPTAFRVVSKGPALNGLTVTLFFGGDVVGLYDLGTAPTLEKLVGVTGRVPVVAVPTPDSIVVPLESIIVQDLGPNAAVRTSIADVSFPQHGFNRIASLTPAAGNRVLVETVLPTTLVGTVIENVPFQPINANTLIELYLPSHGIPAQTSLRLSNSTVPALDGTYVLKVIDADHVAVRPSTTIVLTGTVTIAYGDRVILNDTGVVDGLWDLSTIDATHFYLFDTLLLAPVVGRGIVGHTHTLTLARSTTHPDDGYTLSGLPVPVAHNNYQPFVPVDVDTVRVYFPNALFTSAAPCGGSSLRVSTERHGFLAQQLNTDTWDASGMLFQGVQLSGSNYIILCIDGLGVVETTPDVPNAFAIITLDKPPGYMCHNGFVSTPMEFDVPVTINEFHIQLRTSSGELFDLTRLNYSIQLNVTELREHLDRTNQTEQLAMRTYRRGK